MGRWTGQLCVYSHDVCVGCIYYCMHVWGRDNFQESAVSFPFDLGPRDRTQVTQLAHQVLLGCLPPRVSYFRFITALREMRESCSSHTKKSAKILLVLGSLATYMVRGLCMYHSTCVAGRA